MPSANTSFVKLDIWPDIADKPLGNHRAIVAITARYYTTNKQYSLKFDIYIFTDKTFVYFISISCQLNWGSTRRIFMCQSPTGRAAASTRVLEYCEYWLNYSSNFFTTRVLVTFYLRTIRLQIPISGCSFSSQLMNCRNLCKLKLGLRSRFHLKLASLEIYLNIYMILRASSTLTHRPFFVIATWQIILKYFWY